VHKAFERKYNAKLPTPHPNTPGAGVFDDVAEGRALSDDVYEDESGHIWYQMSPGGTIYHWGEDPSKYKIVASLEAIAQTGGQRFIPVFKLVSPDGTGSSRECIIFNKLTEKVKLPSPSVELMAGQVALGKVNEWVKVRERNLIETHPHYQGSYNFTETV